MIATALDLIRRCEGCKLEAYRDTEGVWTIGWGDTGPNVVEGATCTQDDADKMLARKYAIAQAGAAETLGGSWMTLDPVRRAALINLCYQLGRGGLASFVNMLAAARKGQWQSASDELLASKLHQQTPARTELNARMLLTGRWPKE